MRVPSLFAAAVLVVLGLPDVAAGQSKSLDRVSVDSSGTQGNNDSRTCALSAEGLWVAFVSMADNFVAGDSNGQSDVYLHDRRTGVTTRVSLSSSGLEPDGECVTPAVSSGGRIVAFQSDATNLVDDDTNGFSDIFVHDRVLHTTTRVSLGADEQEGELPCVEPAMSADGNAVAFQSYSTNLGLSKPLGIQDVFVRDVAAGTTVCASRGWQGDLANNSSWAPSLSGDGRYVAFNSQATNLVPSDLNNSLDIFVLDQVTGVTELVSRNTSGAQGNGHSLKSQISANGRFVAFTSYAKNLNHLDKNFDSDVFVHDRQTGVTELISLNSQGVHADEESDWPVISGDGRWVVFHSKAQNLSPFDTNQSRDIFLRDRMLGRTMRLNLGPLLVEGDEDSQQPVIASDTLVVAFESRAQNLVAADSNLSADIFVFDQQ